MTASDALAVDIMHYRMLFSLFCIFYVNDYSIYKQNYFEIVFSTFYYGCGVNVIIA